MASIEDYLAISGAPQDALGRIRALASTHGISIDAALEEAEARMAQIEQAAGG